MNVLIIWCLYADFKDLGDQNQREKICYVASECIALSLLVGIFKNFDIYYSGYIQAHCQKNKKIKGADQILPEVYGTTLNETYLGVFICANKIKNKVGTAKIC